MYTGIIIVAAIDASRNLLVYSFCIRAKMSVMTYNPTNNTAIRAAIILLNMIFPFIIAIFCILYCILLLKPMTNIQYGSKIVISFIKFLYFGDY